MKYLIYIAYSTKSFFILLNGNRYLSKKKGVLDIIYFMDLSKSPNSAPFNLPDVSIVVPGVRSSKEALANLNSSQPKTKYLLKFNLILWLKKLI